MKVRKIVSMVLVMIMVCSLAGCSSNKGTNESSTTDNTNSEADTDENNTSEDASDFDGEVTYFKLGHTQGPDSPVQFTGEKMNELLKERMPQYQIELYPNSQLGGERDMIEAVQLGSQDCIITSTTVLSNFVPDFTPAEMLYLIQDYDHADAVYQGEIGKSWLDACSNAGLVGLGFTEVGFRHMITASKEVHQLSDIKGMKLRVMENDAHVAGWKALGVDAVTTSFSDAFSGMQQGTMDAMEVPWCLIWANGFYDVAKYVVETGHIYTAQVFVMSDKAWNTMSPEEQKIWQECVTEACAAGREYCRNNDAEFKQKCMEKGMTVIEDIDLTEWRESAKPLYAQYDEEYGDMIRRIQELAK